MKTRILCLVTILVFGLNLALQSQTINSWKQDINNGPSARRNHTLLELHAEIYLFGGENYNTGEVFNDLWLYDRDNNYWTEQFPSNPPDARFFHTAVNYDGKMIVFGGMSNSTTFMDVWQYDPEDLVWTELASTSELSDRSYYRALMGENKIWITGGMIDETGQATGEIWSYDPADDTWEQGPDCPSPRYGHAAFYHNNSIYITCGRFQEEILNDMWRFHLPTQQWENWAVQFPPFPPVKFPAFTHVENTLWMTGGTTIDDDGNYVDVPNCHSFNMLEDRWEVNPDGPNLSFGAATGWALPPPPNKNSTSEYEILVFGGSDNGTTLGETWIYNSVTGWGLVDLPENEYSNPINTKVFPSITTGAVNIQCDEIINNISVYNVQGQIVLLKEINSTETQIDLSKNNPGHYFVQVDCDNHRITEKVILTK